MSHGTLPSYSDELLPLELADLYSGEGLPAQPDGTVAFHDRAVYSDGVILFSSGAGISYTPAPLTAHTAVVLFTGSLARSLVKHPSSGAIAITNSDGDIWLCGSAPTSVASWVKVKTGGAGGRLIPFGNAGWFSVGASGEISISDDGITWEDFPTSAELANPSRIFAAGGRLVSFGGGGSVPAGRDVRISQDGRTWQIVAYPPDMRVNFTSAYGFGFDFEGCAGHVFKDYDHNFWIRYTNNLSSRTFTL